MGKRRKNRHGAILKQALPELEAEGFLATVFHHHSRMPKSLKGVPDLYLMHTDLTMWVEIKPLYANYMRDQMSDVQWQWFHDRRDIFSHNTQYAIVTDVDELLKVACLKPDDSLAWIEDYIYVPEYHWGRYEIWRRAKW
ncbi:MAG: hypothetical protein ACYSW8_25135 [Planctomycetota bacterium]|jgi:hypothetical protein